MPFTKITGPEWIYSLKASRMSFNSFPVYLYPVQDFSVYSWNEVSYSGCWEFEMTNYATRRTIKANFGTIWNKLCQNDTCSVLLHSRRVYIYIDRLVDRSIYLSLSPFKENSACIFNRDYLFPDFNLITVHTCNLFLVFYILTWV